MSSWSASSTGCKLVFLPRHGRGHRAAADGNQRPRQHRRPEARRLHRRALALGGRLAARRPRPRAPSCVVDQFIDRTFAREKSFFGPGLVAHVSMAHPVCPRLAALAAEAAREAGASVVEGGTYLAMEGPQFSTQAESELYRSWGCDVIGMTNMPEAKLAREAELPYASVAMVTDYDCWREEIAHVEVSQSGGAERQRRQGRRTWWLAWPTSSPGRGRPRRSTPAWTAPSSPRRTPATRR